MHTEAAETELLDLARQGDQAALAELFARHHERLRQAVALRLDRRLAARLDATDVLQETYLEATRRLADYLEAPEMPFYLWLRWIAGEKVLQARRRHFADKRAVAREVLPLPIDSSAQFVGGLLGQGPSPSQAVASRELAERLQTALGQLDDDERELILWRHFEQLTTRETAQLLRVTEAAASKRHLRAIDRLRELLVGLGVSSGRST